MKKIKLWLIEKLTGVPKGALWGRVMIEEWAMLKPMEDVESCLDFEFKALKHDMIAEIKRYRKERL